VELRLALTADEVERYREIGQLCANIVEGVCQNAKAGQTENEVAAALKCECLKYGVSPDCVLVGADERILNEEGKIDPFLLKPITYDPVGHTYISLGKKVGNAFKDGLKLKGE
jgi:hypothetical protein